MCLQNSKLIYFVYLLVISLATIKIYLQDLNPIGWVIQVFCANLVHQYSKSREISRASDILSPQKITHNMFPVCLCGHGFCLASVLTPDSYCGLCLLWSYTSWRIMPARQQKIHFFKEKFSQISHFSICKNILYRKNMF